MFNSWIPLTLALLWAAEWPKSRLLLFMPAFYDYHWHIVLTYCMGSAHMHQVEDITQFKLIKCNIKVPISHLKERNVL